MTVAELIARLNGMPQDQPVMAGCCVSGGYNIHPVYEIGFASDHDTPGVVIQFEDWVDNFRKSSYNEDDED